jgi:hypothetical protein
LCHDIYCIPGFTAYDSDKITNESAKIKEVTYAFTKEGTTISITGHTIEYDFGNRPLNFTSPLILINQDDTRLNGLSELIQTIDKYAIAFINGDRIKSTEPTLFDGKEEDIDDEV